MVCPTHLGLGIGLQERFPVTSNRANRARINGVRLKRHLHRDGSFEDVFQAIEYLLGANYVTGAKIEVAGGIGCERTNPASNASTERQNGVRCCG